MTPTKLSLQQIKTLQGELDKLNEKYLDFSPASATVE